MPEYKWSPIENLSSDLINFSDTELRAFEEEWKLVREQLSKEAVAELIEQMKREWAIETGKIENLYTLDEGITETLIEHGIIAKYISHNSTNRDPDELEAILLDHKNVIDGLFDFIAGRQELSLHYIRAIHQVFTEHQYYTIGQDHAGNRTQISLIKGAWKKFPNNPKQPDGTLHEYCPPESVQLEMEKLIAIYQELNDNKSIAPEVLAAWLHHRFTQIHPFQDGNGRIARALATLVFLKSGDFPLLVTNKVRSEYIDALEAADFGNLEPLIYFFAEIQKNRLYDAITKSQDVFYDYSLNETNNIRIQEFNEKKRNAENTIKGLGHLTINELAKLENVLVTLGKDVDINLRIPPKYDYSSSNEEIICTIQYKPAPSYILSVQIKGKLSLQTYQISNTLWCSMMLMGMPKYEDIEFDLSDNIKLIAVKFRRWIKEGLLLLTQQYFQQQS